MINRLLLSGVRRSPTDGMPRTYRLTVGPNEAGLRLDQYLVQRLPSTLSRNVIQRLVREGSVTVGGQPAKSHRALRRGESVCAQVEFLRAPGEGPPPVPQSIPLDLVYEDADVLVVNKPAGLVTHPAPGHWDGTLVNAILWHLKDARGSGFRAQGKGPQPPRPAGPDSRGGPAQSPEPQLPRAGIVHRLDKDTSGLLLVAKTTLALTNLGRQLKARTMSRRYYALIDGHLPLDQGTISAAIGRHARHRKEMAIRHLGGRAAVTHYKVMRRYGARGSRLPAPAVRTGGPGKAEGRNPSPITHHPSPIFRYTLLDVSLDTGRTHQIRVHMAHLGFPIMGDTTYGRRPASFWRTLGISRQLLHAYRLSFRHPVTSQPVTLTAPVPEDMKPWVEGIVILRFA